MSRIKFNKEKSLPEHIVLLVCALPDDPWNSQIPGILPANCRNCTQEVIVTPYQKSWAAGQSKETGYMVDHICIPCMMTYAEHAAPECDTCWMCRAEKAGYVSKAA